MDSVRTKNLPGTWETLFKAVLHSYQPWESITRVGLERESEELIVVMKWGNSHGAKELYLDAFEVDRPWS